MNWDRISAKFSLYSPIKQHTITLTLDPQKTQDTKSGRKATTVAEGAAGDQRENWINEVEDAKILLPPFLIDDRTANIHL